MIQIGSHAVFADDDDLTYTGWISNRYGNGMSCDCTELGLAIGMVLAVAGAAWAVDSLLQEVGNTDDDKSNPEVLSRLPCR